MSRDALLWYARGNDLRPSYVKEVLNLLKGGGIDIASWIKNSKDVESFLNSDIDVARLDNSELKTYYEILKKIYCKEL